MDSKCKREQNVAIFDLLDSNTFAPVNHSGGPHRLSFALVERRLIVSVTRGPGDQGQWFSFPAPFQGQQPWGPAGYTTTTNPRSQRNRASRRGRPDNNSNSQFIRYFGLPATRAPDTPIPVGGR
ncbi:UPF0262 family protein [Mesorhizobium sp. M1348]